MVVFVLCRWRADVWFRLLLVDCRFVGLWKLRLLSGFPGGSIQRFSYSLRFPCLEVDACFFVGLSSCLIIFLLCQPPFRWCSVKLCPAACMHVWSCRNKAYNSGVLPHDKEASTAQRNLQLYEERWMPFRENQWPLQLEQRELIKNRKLFELENMKTIKRIFIQLPEDRTSRETPS